MTVKDFKEYLNLYPDDKDVQLLSYDIMLGKLVLHLPNVVTVNTAVKDSLLNIDLPDNIVIIF